jgi:hypothetical protein
MTNRKGHPVILCVSRGQVFSHREIREYPVEFFATIA